MMSFSLGRKIFFSQAVLFFTVLTVIFSTSYFSMRGEIKKIYSRHMSEMLVYHEIEIKEAIDKKFLILERICESREFNDYSMTNRDLPLVQYFSKFNEEFKSLSYINKEGKTEVMAADGKRLLGFTADIPLKQYSWNNLLELKNKPVVELRYSSGGGVSALDFYMASFQYFGDKFVGGIWGSVPLDQFFSRIYQQQLGATRVYFLVDKQSNILFSSGIINGFPGNFNFSKIYNFSSGESNGEFSASISGKPYLFRYRLLKSPECFLVAAVSFAEMMNPVYKLRNAYLFIFSGLFMVTIVFIYVLTQRIVAPIKRLVYAAGRVAQGDFSLRIGISSNDETGLLVSSFNKMVETLNKSVVSKAYLDSIIMNMQDLLLVISLEKKIILVNEALCRLLGYKSDELIGLSVDVILSPKQRAADKGFLNKTNYEAIFVSRFLQEVPVLLSCAHVNKSKGQEEYFVLTAKDIPERKIFESALQEKEKLYRDLINIYPQAIIVTDKDFYISMINQWAVSLFGGRNAEEIIGRSFMDFVVMDDLAVILNVKNNVSGSKEAEITMRKENDTLVPVEFIMKTIGDIASGEKLVFLLCDISLDKRSNPGFSV